MTELEKLQKQRDNYMSNTARMMGFYQGGLEVLAKELVKEKSVWTPQEIGEKILKMLEITETWDKVKYEGSYGADDIRKMLEDKKNSEIVELERA
jgi:uncharacterized membrane protein